MFSLVAMMIVGQMPAGPIVSVTLTAQTRAKQTVSGVATITFASGLHAYQNPPSDEYEIPVKLSVSDKSFSLVKVSYPKGKDMTMPGDTKPSKVYEGKTVIPFVLKVAAKPGIYHIPLKLAYQQCNDRACFPPASVEVNVSLTVKR